MVLYATVIPYNYNSLDSDTLDPAEVIIMMKKNLKINAN